MLKKSFFVVGFWAIAYISTTMPEWTKYDCGPLPGSRGFSLKIPTQLTEVYHVCHIDTALRIMKDDQIKAGLIGDHSKLKTQRIPVAWLSPNEWFYGSRYGSVSFAYNFKSLIRGKRFYWVEVMTEYSPHAPRILVTDKEHDDLDEYNPVTAKGPWKYDPDTDRHYWNGDITLEFMFEASLPLKQCFEIKTVKHNATMCCIDPKTCNEMGMSPMKAGVKFFTSILTQGIVFYYRQLTNGKKGARTPNRSLSDAMGSLYVKATRQEFAGTVRRSSRVSDSLVRASLAALASDHLEDYKLLLREFNSERDYTAVLQRVLKEYFEISSLDLD